MLTSLLSEFERVMMTTKTTPKLAITAEYLDEVTGVESIITGGLTARLIRYTLQTRYDENPISFVVSNEKGTVGGMFYYQYVQWHGAVQDISKEVEQLSKTAQRSVERIEEYGFDNQLWVLSQIIERINEGQIKSQRLIEKCLAYAEIITGKVRA